MIGEWLKTVPYDGPTTWAMDSLIIGREALTPWGGFRQALREVAARRSLEEQGPRCARELAHFERRAEELGAALVDAHGPLTPEVCSRLDEAHVEAKARLLVALDLITTSRITPGTAELLLALRPEKRAALIDMIGATPDQLVTEVVTAGAIE